MNNKNDLELLNSIYDYLKTTQKTLSEEQLWTKAFNDFLGHSYSGNYNRIKDLNSAKEDLIEFANYDETKVNSIKKIEDLKSILNSNPDSYDEIEESLQRIYGQSYQDYLKTQILDFIKNYDEEFYSYYDDLFTDGGTKTYDEQNKTFFEIIASNLESKEYEEYFKNQWNEIPDFYESTSKIAKKPKIANWSKALFDIYLEFEQYDIIPQEVKDKKITKIFGKEKTNLLQEKFDQYWKKQHNRHAPKIKRTINTKKR